MPAATPPATWRASAGSVPPGADIGPLPVLGVDDNPRVNPPNPVVTVLGKITRFNLNATDAFTVRFTCYRP